MTSQQIQYVIALAEEKNFSKAAERLFISQPALSQFIKNVEKEVGMPLFDRGTNPIQLTPAGEIYLKTAKEILMTEKELQRKIADLSELTTGHFSIGTSAFRASCLLPKSIREFEKRHPGIKLEIVTDHVSQLKQMLLVGDIDLCIEADDFDTMLYHSEELFQENYYLALYDKHEFNDKNRDKALTKRDILEDSKKLYTAKEIDIKEIGDFPFITMKNGTCFSNTIQKICRELKYQPTEILEVSQIETAFHWINEGLACALIPDTLIRYGNFEKHPIYYKIPARSSSQPIVVAMKKNRYVTHAMQEYIAVLRELIGYGTWSITMD